VTLAPELMLIFCATICSSIQQLCTWNKVQYLADEMSAKSPGFKK
jgi:hypothetical protein